MVFRLLIFFTLLIAGCGTTYSQNFIFNRLSIGDGLLSNNILTVWRDKIGYLWLGSESGLQRYDGTHFRTIRNERTDQVLADDRGRVWIRSGRQIGIFNTENFAFTNVSYEGSAEVYNNTKIWLRKDASGNVFLVLTGKSCQYFNDASYSFSVSDNPFIIPESVGVTDVLEDLLMNRYWILSDNDFGYWDKQTKKYYNAAANTQKDNLLISIPSSLQIQKFFIDGGNKYWIYGNDGKGSRFLCFNNVTHQFTSDTSGLNAGKDYFEVYNFKRLTDTSTALYGLNCFRINNGGEFQNLKTGLNNPFGIHFNSISDIMQDQEGLIWVATDNGLYYTNSKWNSTHIVFDAEKRRAPISSLREDRNNHLWIGTWGQGIYIFDKKQDILPVRPFESITHADPFASQVWSICEDDEGDMWVGCEQGRLVHYRVKNKKSILYRPPIFRDNAIRQIIKDVAGNLWFGLRDGRLLTANASRFNKNNIRLQHSFGGSVITMSLIKEIYLWIAINGKGIYVVDTRSGKLTDSINASKAGTSLISGIKDILPVNDTLCLIAGEKTGAVNLRTLNVDFNWVSSPLLSGSIFALQKDAYNNCWLGGRNGIFKLNLFSRMVTKFSQKDGLITVHNNSYVPERSTGLQSGLLAFGGNQHLVIFNPANYSQSFSPPVANITGFQLNGRYLPEDSLAQLKTIKIPYEHRVFRIDFAALNFLQTGRFTYEYHLEGLDKDWISSTSPIPVNYNFLPHGQYRFFVRTKNEQGQYSDAATLRIYVAPPFWKTGWFYSILALLAGIVLFYLHRLRLQKLLHVEKVRSRLARDLHDDMGSTLSTINILSNMALQQPSLDESKIKAYMNTINLSTSQMMEAMDDIVWSINPVNDNIAKIVARMKETAGAILEPRQIDYCFDVDPSVSDLHLAMDVRRELFLIFKEALNNLVKYAQASAVRVAFGRKGSYLIFTIEDNGVGFEIGSPGSAVRGNGLKNMQKRASYLKGHLSITAQPGKGTVVKLVAPIA